MRQRCLPTRDSDRAHQLDFQPPDPVGAPTLAVARARKALRAFDRYLVLHWSPVIRVMDERPGRWTIKEWGPQTGTFSTVVIWEGPNGEYRGEFPVDAMLAAVASKSTGGMSATDFLASKDAANATFDKKREDKRDTESWREANVRAAFDNRNRFTPTLKTGQNRRRGKVIA